MTNLEQQARKLIGDAWFDRIVREQSRANALRAAEVRLYAEQHQARAFWELAKQEEAR